MRVRSIPDPYAPWRRAMVAVVAYFFSALGLAFTGASTWDLLRKPIEETPPVLILAPLIWLGAWAVHLVLAVSWVWDRRMPRAWCVTDMALGGLGVLAVPTVMVEFSTPSAATIKAFLLFLVIGTIAVASALLLAVKLVRFHWRRV